MGVQTTLFNGLVVWWSDGSGNWVYEPPTDVTPETPVRVVVIAHGNNVGSVDGTHGELADASQRAGALLTQNL